MPSSAQLKLVANYLGLLTSNVFKVCEVFKDFGLKPFQVLFEVKSMRIFC